MTAKKKAVKKTKAKKKRVPKPRAAAAEGSNTPSREELEEYFERLHSLTDGMEEANATARGDIKAVYEEAAEALDVPKNVLQLYFRKDRIDRKIQKKVRKFDGREREGFEKLAQTMGADTPLGRWAEEMAEGAAAESSDDDEQEDLPEQDDESATQP